MILRLNQRINAKCVLLAQVQIGFTIVDVYSWGAVVVSRLNAGLILDVYDGECKDRLLRDYPPGLPDLSRRLASEISKARNLILGKE